MPDCETSLPDQKSLNQLSMCPIMSTGVHFQTRLKDLGDLALRNRG